MFSQGEGRADEGAALERGGPEASLTRATHGRWHAPRRRIRRNDRDGLLAQFAHKPRRVDHHARARREQLSVTQEGAHLIASSL